MEYIEKEQLIQKLLHNIDTLTKENQYLTTTVNLLQNTNTDLADRNQQLLHQLQKVQQHE